MLHPDEARAIVLSHAKPLGAELVQLEDAAERILAEPLTAPADLPPFRASTMDGFAVPHDGPTVGIAVIGADYAGAQSDVTVTTGTATRIMTGAPVPQGADAVVPFEHTDLTGDRLDILEESVQAGQNIRPIGSDMQKGQLLIEAGTLLGPAEVGIFASVGQTQISAGRRPKVVVYSTGDELVPPGEEPGPGQIRDSNRFSLAIAARRAGAEVINTAHVADNEDAVREAFRSALDEADVLITSGGVSMGDRDLVKALLGDVAEVHFRRVFMKPGKPLNFATVGDKLIFGLPGNPVSCLVSFHTFVRPAIEIMQGGSGVPDARIPVRTTMDIQPSDRIELQRAIVELDSNGELVARTTGSQISARLMSFVGANAFLVIKPGEATVPAGSTVPAILLAAPRVQSTNSD